MIGNGTHIGYFDIVKYPHCQTQRMLAYQSTEPYKTEWLP